MDIAFNYIVFLNKPQLTFNQWVAGSNPARLTTNVKGLAEKRWAFYFSGLQMGYKKRLFDGEFPLI